MSDVKQLRGGSAAMHSTFVGAAKEVTVNTDDYSLRVHDGETAGGHVVGGASAGVGVNKAASKDYNDGTRIITVSGDQLQCGGKPIRDIGVTAYELTPNYINNGDLNFIHELQVMAEQGVRFVRLGVGCWWANQWKDNFFGYGGETAEEIAALRAEWARKLITFLDVAKECGIGIVYSVFWKHQDMADVAGETISAAFTAGSQSYAYATEVLEYIVPKIKDHTALAGWEIGNEYTLVTANEALPHVDVAHGTRATYAAPADLMTDAMLRDFHSWFATKVQSMDDTGRMIMSGNAGSGGVVERTIENYLENFLCQDNPAPLNTVSIHKYSRNQFGHRAYDDLRDTLVQIRRKVKSNSSSEGIDQGFVLGEFGSELVEHYNGFGNLEVVRTACEAIERSGVQLAFAWDWARSTATDDSNNFSFHPDNVENGTDEKWAIIKASIERLRAEPEAYIDPYALPLDTPTVRGGQAAMLAGTAEPTLMTAPSATSMYFATGFCISTWLYVDETPNKDRIILSHLDDNAFNKGWFVGITGPEDEVGAGAPFVKVYWTDGQQTNTATSLVPIQSTGWHHLFFQLETDVNSDNFGLTVMYDGRWNTTYNIGTKTWAPATAYPFSMFARDKIETDGSLSIYEAKPAKVGFKDVIFHGRSLNDREMRHEYMFNEPPIDKVGSSWVSTKALAYPLDGTFTGTDGSTLTVSQHSGTNVGPTPAFVSFPK